MVAPASTRLRTPWTRTTDLGAELHAALTWLRAPGLWRRVLPAIRAHLSAAPASTAYAFTLFITWWTLRGLGEAAQHRLILSASTNLYNMRHNPLQVLVASAFWTDGGFPWNTIVSFLIVMAAAERWLGTARWILVYSAGHIGATLLIITGISRAIDANLIPHRIGYASDVGTSYGFTAVLAVLAFRFTGAVRVAWVITLGVVLGLSAWEAPNFTNYGHICAAIIGLIVALVATTFWHFLDRAESLRRSGEHGGHGPEGDQGHSPEDHQGHSPEGDRGHGSAGRRDNRPEGAPTN
ncbi:rhomboid-like protein [Nocardia panacis]|uniref:rhomboid-like protein n=1 Tax=Nocardia panacis TaxID=2340916 RepID=UPI00193AD838|nr:rhomboid-like protein [Nocardia panacis]